MLPVFRKLTLLWASLCFASAISFSGCGQGVVSTKEGDATVEQPTSESSTSGANVAPINIFSVTPSSGPVAGGTAITIVGSNFVSGTSVFVGGTTCADTIIVASTQITCRTPLHVAGGVDLVVQLPNGRTQIANNIFTYLADLSFTSISPTAGSLSGGTNLTILGTGFMSGATVLIGGTACTSVVLETSQRITCVSPVHIAGLVSVRVTNSNGQYVLQNNAYTYQAAPTISGIVPPGGSIEGGTVVSVNGANFLPGAVVTLGGQSCVSTTYVSSSALTCVTPMRTAGAVNVVATNPDGQAATEVAGYTFRPALDVTAISPNNGALAGGTAVTITGSGFVTGASITFDGTACTSVTVVSSSSITCTTPAHAAAAVNVVVRNTDSQQGTLIGGFTYIDKIRYLRALAVGSGHSCSLTSDGAVLCWGLNGHGELGDGTTTSRLIPVAVTLASARSIAVGAVHTCALLADGTVKCWGDNTYGQLGDASNTQRTTPVTVSGLSGVTAISAGGYHTCAVLVSGQVRCWGNNSIGQLGDNSTTSSNVPVAVVGISGIRDVRVATTHTCALSANGNVYCWGYNNVGQLGNNGTTDSPVPVLVKDSGVNTLTDAVSLAGGWNHTCAVLSAGTVVCWGFNGSGQLGNGTVVDSVLAVPVQSISDAVEASVGSGHSCVRTAGGVVKCWGANSSGQLGDGSTSSSLSSVAVNLLSDVRAFAIGEAQGCAAVATGDVFCWGSNGLGQLGDNSTTSRTTPVRVVKGASANSRKVAALSAGSSASAHSCAISANGTVSCWGLNDVGQFGNNTTTNATSPTASNADDAVKLALGEKHTCALLASGSVECWGTNASGQLGDGTTTARHVPVSVSGGYTAVDIQAGAAYSCMLLTDRTVKCWGSINSSSTPATVASLAGVKALAAGTSHACALLDDSSVWCWGANASGQLGINNTTTQASPMQVHGVGNSGYLSGAVSVAAAVDHTCALLGDGTVACWGSDASGQQGNGGGAGADQLYPMAVSGISTARALAVGASFSCVALADGTASCWGLNASGQLGDNSLVTKYSPVAVGSLAGVLDLSLGASHACALLSTGAVNCWGANASGQLGNSSTTQSSVPVVVGDLP